MWWGLRALELHAGETEARELGERRKQLARDLAAADAVVTREVEHLERVRERREQLQRLGQRRACVRITLGCQSCIG